jgi:hypothetical protein
MDRDELIAALLSVGEDGMDPTAAAVATRLGVGTVEVELALDDLVNDGAVVKVATYWMSYPDDEDTPRNYVPPRS